MRRLKHSRRGYLRYMQMSRVSLFIFVEAHTPDRYVYSRIAEEACANGKTEYLIVAAHELWGDGGGKKRLLNFFDYLRRKGCLAEECHGKKRIRLFFLDKDVDDLIRRTRRCSHIVYTETYALENYLYKYGDISQAAAAAASLGPRCVQRVIGDNTDWCRRVATMWKEWVGLCLFAKVKKLRCMANYRVKKSPVNDGIYGAVNKVSYGQLLSVLKRKSGLKADDFDRSFIRLSRKVDQIYSNGEHDRIFKGTWYTSFLVEDVKKIARGRRINDTALGLRIITNLAQTLSCKGAWAERFRKPIRKFVATAQI